MIVYSHPDCLLKFNGQGHPERKERLDSILKSIKSSNLKVEFKEAPKVDLEIVSLVHPKKHIEELAAKGWVRGGLPSREIYKNKNVQHN